MCVCVDILCKFCATTPPQVRPPPPSWVNSQEQRLADHVKDTLMISLSILRFLPDTARTPRVLQTNCHLEDDILMTDFFFLFACEFRMIDHNKAFISTKTAQQLVTEASTHHLSTTESPGHFFQSDITGVFNTAPKYYFTKMLCYCTAVYIHLQEPQHH